MQDTARFSPPTHDTTETHIERTQIIPNVRVMRRNHTVGCQSSDTELAILLSHHPELITLRGEHEK